jgi:hypothetical protein
MSWNIVFLLWAMTFFFSGLIVYMEKRKADKLLKSAVEENRGGSLEP